MISHMLEYYQGRIEALVGQRCALVRALEDCVDELSAWESDRSRKSSALREARTLLASTIDADRKDALEKVADLEPTKQEEPEPDGASGDAWRWE